jgi:hypothetical protein
MMEPESGFESSKGRSAAWPWENCCGEPMGRQIPPPCLEQQSLLRVFSFRFLLSADESGGHMLTRTRGQNREDLKIFGFQNDPGADVRAGWETAGES